MSSRIPRRPQHHARGPAGNLPKYAAAVSFLAASCLTIATLGAPSAAAATAAPSVAMTALINGDSITLNDGITDSLGNGISLEQYAAQHAGYTVTVVTGSQWSAMTAADFAKYQVLIVGDPSCSTIPSSATDNSATWAPVVMNTSGLHNAVGNRTVVGTDPEYHYAGGGGGAAPTNPADPSTAGAEHLVESGITYAGGVAGATGFYFDTSCGDNGTATSVLNSLSATGTGFSQDDSPPCGGSVQLIASNPVFAAVTDADIQGWGCSDHTTYPTYPTDWQPLAVATDTATTPTCGTDPITSTTACGESYVLVSGNGIVVTAPDLALTPPAATSAVGGTHTVTATVTKSGAPVNGQLVAFTVTGQNAGVSGPCSPATCISGADGLVTFTYTDANGAGTDTVNASINSSGTTEHATASQSWTAVNHPPTADPKNITTPQDTSAPVTLTGSDPDSDPLTFSVVTNPTHGTLSGTGAALTYTPATGYSGPDSFTYKANDGKADSAPATVSITVTPVKVNHPPTADAKTITTPQDTAAPVTLTGSDPDSDPLTFSVVTNPTHGTLSGTGAALTYTPATGYSGPDSFTYKANDGKADSAPATVSITVTPKATGCATTAPTGDVVVAADQKTPSSTFKSPAVTTAAAELILAFVEADGPASPTQKVLGVTGGGLTWTLVARSNLTWGTTEVWQASGGTALTGAVVSAKLASAFDGSITVATFKGAMKVGAIGTGAGTTGTPVATIKPTGCNSRVWAAGHDWSKATAPVAGAGQTLVHTFVDKRVHDSFWTQSVAAPTVAGTSVAVTDTAPTKDRWTMAAVEILAAS